MLGEILWTIIGWVLKALCVIGTISLFVMLGYYIFMIVSNEGRKWYYYNPSKPWKGGYWEPQLPSIPPYNEYEWNPRTARFEHKITRAPLNPGEKTLEQKRAEICKESGNWQWDWDALGYPEYTQKPTTVKPDKKRPEWIRFLFEENLGTLREKHKRRKEAERQGSSSGRIH